MTSYDRAYLAYLRHFGEEHSSDMLHQFQDTYIGSWPSFVDYVRERLGVFELAHGPVGILDRQEFILGVYHDDSLLALADDSDEVYIFDDCFKLAQSSVA